MAKATGFKEKNLAPLERHVITDVKIFMWITSARYHIPSLSIMDCAKSFLAHEKIDEGDLNIEKIKKTFIRIQSEIFEDSKTKHHG